MSDKGSVTILTIAAFCAVALGLVLIPWDDLSQIPEGEQGCPREIRDTKLGDLVLGGECKEYYINPRKLGALEVNNLTIEKGVKVFMAHGAIIRAQKSLVIAGTEEERVHIAPKHRNFNWGFISAKGHEALLRVNNATIEGGLGIGGYHGAIHVGGTGIARMKNVEVIGPRLGKVCDHPLDFKEWPGISTWVASKHVTFENVKVSGYCHDISINARQLEEITPESGFDTVYVQRGSFSGVYELHREINYIFGDFDMVSSRRPLKAKLIIPPGTTVRFDEMGGIRLRSGQLHAVGEPDNPIRFLPYRKGATWWGLSFWGEVGGTKIEHAIIENVGRRSSKCALNLSSVDENAPVPLIIKNTKFIIGSEEISEIFSGSENINLITENVEVESSNGRVKLHSDAGAPALQDP